MIILFSHKIAYFCSLSNLLDSAVSGFYFFVVTMKKRSKKWQQNEAMTWRYLG